MDQPKAVPQRPNVLCLLTRRSEAAPGLFFFWSQKKKNICYFGKSKDLDLFLQIKQK